MTASRRRFWIVMSKAVIHMGDNLTGDGDGDDEQILIDLSKVPEVYDKIVWIGYNKLDKFFKVI